MSLRMTSLTIVLLAFSSMLPGCPRAPILFTTSTLESSGGDAGSFEIGDVNNDGYPDLIVCHAEDALLYFNNGTEDPFLGVQGTTLTGFPFCVIASGDLNGDGFADLVGIGAYLTGSTLLLNNGSAEPFQDVEGADLFADLFPDIDVLTFREIELGDLNGDGNLDIVVASFFGSPNLLYLNNGTSEPFNGVVGANIGEEIDLTVDIDLGDVNGDGFIDVLAGNLGSGGRLVLNNGTADPFSNVESQLLIGYSSDFALGDLNQNGRLDAVTWDLLYLNNGTQTPFSDEPKPVDNGGGTVVKLGDLNNDGYLDVMYGSDEAFSGTAAFFYLLNNGTQDPFDGVRRVNVSEDVREAEDLELADMNGDGLLDIVRLDVAFPNRSVHIHLQQPR